MMTKQERARIVDQLFHIGPVAAGDLIIEFEALLSEACKLLAECVVMDKTFDALCICAAPEKKLYDVRTKLFERVDDFIRKVQT